MICGLKFRDVPKRGGSLLAWLTAVFLHGAALALLLTAAVKLASFFQADPYLSLRNPALGFMTNRALMVTAGLVELGVLALLLSRLRNATKLWWVLWLSAILLAYRAGLAWIGAPTNLCPCLGHLGSWLHLRGVTVHLWATGLLAYLSVGSVLCLLAHGLSGGRRGAASASRALSSLGAGALVAGIFLPLSASRSLGAAAGFDVSGEVTYRAFSKQGNLTAQRRLAFAVSVSGCRCDIRMTGFPRDEWTGSQEYLADGTNVFFISRVLSTNMREFKEFARQKGIRIHRGKQTVSADRMHEITPASVTVKRREDELPDYDLSLVLPVWVAYGSACYYRHGRDQMGRVERPFMVGYGIDKTQSLINARTTFYSREDGGLVRSIDYLNNGVSWVLEGNEMKKSHYSPPFEKGFVEGSYRIMQETNMSGVRVPTRFRLTRYVPVPRASGSNDVMVATTFEGRARAVSLNPPETDFSLRIPAKCLVIDRRFPPRPGRTGRLHTGYMIQNGQIPGLGSVRQTRNYRALLALEGAAPKIQLKRRLLLAALVVLVISPIVVMSATKRRKMAIHKTNSKA
jgi:hypothetical protein